MSSTFHRNELGNLNFNSTYEFWNAQGRLDHGDNFFMVVVVFERNNAQGGVVTNRKNTDIANNSTQTPNSVATAVSISRQLLLLLFVVAFCFLLLLFVVAFCFLLLTPPI